MEKYLLFVFSLSLLSRGQASSNVACPSNAQKVISYDNNLLPPSSIAASSEDLESNPADQLFGRNNVPFNLWCTAPDTGINQQINASFTEPVLIIGIVSSGFANGYVTNFTIEYSMEYPPEHILPYKMYSVHEIDTVLSLKDPIALQWLRLTTYDGVIAPSGRLCWHLTLLGCRYKEAILEVPTSTTAQYTTTTSITVLATSTHWPTSSSIPQITSSVTVTNSTRVREQTTVTTTVTVRDYRLLVITVPTAVCTVLLVLAIVTLGVVICLRHMHTNWRRSSREFSKIPSSETLRVLDNATLYSKSRTATISPSINVVQALPCNHRPSNLHLNDALYENQPSTPTPNQEPHPYEAVTPTRSTAQRTNSMVDNPTYNVPFQPPSPPIAPPPPPPLYPTIKPPKIDLVNNECYSLSESFTNYEATEDLDYCSTGNIYETPQ